MYLDPGAGLGGHTLAVRGVNARPGQAEAARHLRVAVLGRQVERLQGRGYIDTIHTGCPTIFCDTLYFVYLHALAVCHVHVAAECAQGLREPQLAVARAHVHGGLALAVSCVEVRARVEQQQRRVGVVAPVQGGIISGVQGG